MFPEVTDTLIYGARTNRWAYAKYGFLYRIHCVFIISVQKKYFLKL